MYRKERGLADTELRPGDRVRNVSGDVSIEGAVGRVVEVRVCGAGERWEYTIVGVRYDEARPGAAPVFHFPEELTREVGPDG
jgi:hypothetical protein